MSPVTEIPKPEVEERKDFSVRLPLPQKAPSAPPVPARMMFADSLLEPLGQERRRRRWSTAFSFLLQCSLLGVLVLVPLMFTDVLPKQELLTFLIAPPPPPPPPPAAAAVVKVVRQIESEIMNGRLRSPSRIPQQVQMIKEEEAPPPLNSGTGVVGGVPGGIPGGQLGGVIGGIISSTASTAAVPKLVAPKRIRISQGVTKGQLIRKVEPPYPVLARQARIQGEVLLKAIVSKSGEITELRAVSGHPMLVPAALAAVKDWRYRPFLLNGEPVEVETEITVIFRLGG